ncbi:TonB-dependent siderophore receptor [Brevundimonas sp.]|uniref:TonB-dependent receptor plug domain-containing protein n=1 Tax=Brevundimonas sp. TaxID=1871086 RepID=UPI002628A9A1|nr:TonB-dependent receptor [Brevundimonas sp.]
MTTSTQTSLRLAALLTGCSVLACAPVASARTVTQDETANVDEIVVTGTRLSNRTVVNSPVPIDVLTREDIEHSGHSGTARILQTLIPSLNYPTPTTPDGNTHIRSANLRGLSPDQTLVLLNGHRRHTAAWVNVGGTIGKGSVPTDLNAIPPSAIGRVEVLRDGASAQYGSDAIAGVVNLILREDLGSEFTVSGGTTQDGGGDTYEASFDHGWALGDDGVLHGTLYYRNVEAANRARPDLRQFYFGRTPTGGQGVLSDRFGAGVGLNPPGGATGTTLDPREASVDRNVWRFADSADIEQTVLFLNGRKQLGSVEAYAFGGYDRSDATSNASFRRPGQNENVRAIYPDGFLPYVDTLSTNVSISAGLRGDLAGWGWDLSTTWGRNELEYRTHNTLNATLGAASPTSFYNGRLEAAQWTTNLDLTREFDVGLYEPVQIAAGAELRYDFYEIGAGELASYQWGPARVLDGPGTGAVPTIGSQGFAGIQPGDEVDTDRRNVSVYAEAGVRPIEPLQLTGAIRFEDFSDFGSTTNVQAAARYDLGSGLAVRGSAGTGFHAPALAQQFYSSTSSRTLNNPVTGVPEFVLVRTAPVSSPVARLLGAKDLEPEEATNLSFGATWQGEVAGGSLSASVDAYRIEIDDRIALSSNFVDTGTSTAIRSFLAAQGFPGVTSVRYFANVGDTRTEGFDVSGRWRRTTDTLGTFTVTAGYNRNETELTRVASTPAELVALGVRTPLFDITEITRTEKGQPRDNLQIGVTWHVDRFSISVRGVRYGEVQQLILTNQTPAAVAAFRQGRTGFNALPTQAGAAGNFDLAQILEPEVLTDINVAYRFTDRLTGEIGVNNVFNVYGTENIASTAAFSGGDTFGAFPYSEYSPFGWSGAFGYVKLRASF